MTKPLLLLQLFPPTFHRRKTQREREMGTQRVLISPSETKDKEEEESKRVLKLATTTTTKKFLTSCNKSNSKLPTSFKQSQPKLQ
jgi:hypothetical protein